MIDYIHVQCSSCGGIVRLSTICQYQFVCSKCGKEIPLCSLDYDDLKINRKTGWVFPVWYKEGSDIKNGVSYQISSNHGHINGTITRNNIFGVVVEIL